MNNFSPSDLVYLRDIEVPHLDTRNFFGTPGMWIEVKEIDVTGMPAAEKYDDSVTFTKDMCDFVAPYLGKLVKDPSSVSAINQAYLLQAAKEGIAQHLYQEKMNADNAKKMKELFEKMSQAQGEGSADKGPLQ